MRKTLTIGATVVALFGMAAGNADAATVTWKIAQVNDLPKEDAINALAVTKGGSSWAGGSRTVNGAVVPLVQHLTGKRWKTVPSPAGKLRQINSIAASSKTNVWAFGGVVHDSYGARWNGRHWTTTKLAKDFQVVDSAALTAKDVWAIAGEYRSYAEHWTGHSWKKVTLPAKAYGISGVSRHDVWAVGTYKSQPAVLRWNGKKWKRVKTPAFTLPDPYAEGVLHDVVALSAKNVWAVGGLEWACGEDGDDTCSKPLIMHWNGHRWSSTIGATTYTSYLRVTSDGSGGVWALLGQWDPKLVHKAGGGVTTVTAPRPAGHDVILWDLATRGRTVWAGGAAYPEGDPDDPTGNGVYLRAG